MIWTCERLLEGGKSSILIVPVKIACMSVSFLPHYITRISKTGSYHAIGCRALPELGRAYQVSMRYIPKDKENRNAFMAGWKTEVYDER